MSFHANDISYNGHSSKTQQIITFYTKCCKTFLTIIVNTFVSNVISSTPCLELHSL